LPRYATFPRSIFKGGEILLIGESDNVKLDFDKIAKFSEDRFNKLSEDKANQPDIQKQSSLVQKSTLLGGATLLGIYILNSAF
jgi:hypothetical protein